MHSKRNINCFTSLYCKNLTRKYVTDESTGIVTRHEQIKRVVKRGNNELRFKVHRMCCN